MADTVRTMAELQVILADNGIGAISAQDVRDFLVTSFDIVNTTSGALNNKIWTSGSIVTAIASASGAAVITASGIADGLYVQKYQTTLPIGNPTVSGSWQIIIDSEDLKVQKYNGATWDTIGTFIG